MDRIDDISRIRKLEEQEKRPRIERSEKMK